MDGRDRFVQAVRDVTQWKAVLTKQQLKYWIEFAIHDVLGAWVNA